MHLRFAFIQDRMNWAKTFQANRTPSHEKRSERPQESRHFFSDISAKVSSFQWLPNGETENFFKTLLEIWERENILQKYSRVFEDILESRSIAFEHYITDIKQWFNAHEYRQQSLERRPLKEKSTNELRTFYSHKGVLMFVLLHKHTIITTDLIFKGKICHNFRTLVQSERKNGTPCFDIGWQRSNLMVPEVVLNQSWPSSQNPLTFESSTTKNSFIKSVSFFIKTNCATVNLLKHFRRLSRVSDCR